MKITKDMTLGQIVKKYPETVPIFQSKGMSCLGCPSAQHEKLTKGAALHGLDVDELIEQLNSVIR